MSSDTSTQDSSRDTTRRLKTEEELSKIISVANQTFMSKLYQTMIGQRLPLFPCVTMRILFSPFSIYIQLLFMYLGAVEETAVEMRKYLFFLEDRDQLLRGLQELLRQFECAHVKTAIDMFVHHSFKLRAKFKSDLKKFLNCNIRQVDFAAINETAKLINSWAVLHTNNKMDKLITEDLLNEEFEFVIPAVMCFEDNWLIAFDDKDTNRREFWDFKDKYKIMNMMHISGNFHYVQTETFKALQLPFKNETMKMLIFLPNETDGLTDLEKKLPELDIMSFFDKTEPVRVDVTIPKFILKKNNYNLNFCIQQLGLGIIFNKKKANFTGMHRLGQELVNVAKIQHTVIIELNEKGVEMIVKIYGFDADNEVLAENNIVEGKEVSDPTSGEEIEKNNNAGEKIEATAELPVNKKFVQTKQEVESPFTELVLEKVEITRVKEVKTVVNMERENINAVSQSIVEEIEMVGEQMVKQIIPRVSEEVKIFSELPFEEEETMKEMLMVGDSLIKEMDSASKVHKEVVKVEEENTKAVSWSIDKEIEIVIEPVVKETILEVSNEKAKIFSGTLYEEKEQVEEIQTVAASQIKKIEIESKVNRNVVDSAIKEMQVTGFTGKVVVESVVDIMKTSPEEGMTATSAADMGILWHESYQSINSFVADHPFIFCILCGHTTLIIGRGCEFDNNSNKT